MIYYVYIIISKRNNSFITYVGYTKDIKKRINMHNESKGAKFTRGRKWKLIYKETYNSKISAMKAEYKLKKNHKLRNKIKNNYLYK